MKVKIEHYMSTHGQVIAQLEIKDYKGGTFGVSVDVNVAALFLHTEESEYYVSLFRRKAVELGCPLTKENVDTIREYFKGLVSELIEEE